LNSRIIILLLLPLFFFPGCDRANEETHSEKTKTLHQEKQTPEIKPVTVLVDSIDAALVETATAALPIWRGYAQHKPALVLFSNDPFLEPVPAQLHDQALELVRTGSPAQIQLRAVDITPNPLLLHTMAVDAALRAGFFSELAWVLPLKDEEQLPALDVFRQRLLDRGLISQTEAETFTELGDRYTAVLRGIPVTIGTLSNIPLPKKPAWVHIDLSFFNPLYKNEVSTPLYSLVLNTLRKIREAGIKSIGATISQSNLGGALSLNVRFLGKDLRHLFETPASVDEGLPELQFRRTQNLYLAQFMKKDEILENCLKMESLAPDDASVKFDLYSASRELRRGNQALDYLEQAVALDPMYAYEYIFLAETAIEKTRPDASFEMLKKAHEIFPANPLISIMEVDLNIRLGHREAALKLLKQLQELPWSKVYDQDVPARLENMKKIAETLPAGH